VSIVAHTPGRFVWRERTTPDAGIAREFYSELLGWTWEEVQSIDGLYWVAYADETRVGGLWRPPSGASMPVAWNSYLSVEDVDAITRRAQEMGWKVFRPPTEIPGIGRFSVIADFAGAAVLPYRNVGPDPSPGEVAPPGAFCWESLVTSDIPRALREYGTLFGWRCQSSPSGEVPIFAVDDTRGGQVADVQRAQQGPPRWLTYVRVMDASLCSSRVEKLGGKVVVPRVDIPQGTISFIADPGGAMFGLFQMA